MRTLLTNPDANRAAKPEPSPLPRLLLKMVLGVVAGCLFGAFLAMILYGLGLF